MTCNFREGVFSSHKPPRLLPEALETPKHQKNSSVCLGLSIPLNYGNTYFFQGQISPEPPGTPKQSLVRPLGSLEVTNYLVNNYNYKKKRKNLLPLETIRDAEKEKKEFITIGNDYRREKGKKLWISCEKEEKKVQEIENLEASREADKEFRQKPELNFQLSKIVEFPEEDRNHFEYITKNFSKDMNYNLSRWLKFREFINTIQNFDIMKFTQTFEKIEIDEKARVQKRVNKIEFTTKVQKIAKRTKDVYKVITNKEKGISLFREEAVLLYLAGALPYGLNDKIVYPLYQELKKIKKNGKMNENYGNGYYRIR
jgi:hypothetical protein